MKKILALDVHYKSNTAKTVGLLFEDWRSEKALETLVDYQEIASDYIPGEFYKRELPCLLSLIEKTRLDELSCIVLDSYVWLSNEHKKGLGAHLYDALKGQVPIIGVAKKRFFENEELVRKVMRGESQNPLYISALGIDVETARAQVQSMHGPFRIPSLLKELDQLTKQD